MPHWFYFCTRVLVFIIRVLNVLGQIHAHVEMYAISKWFIFYISILQHRVRITTLKIHSLLIRLRPSFPLPISRHPTHCKLILLPLFATVFKFYMYNVNASDGMCNAILKVGCNEFCCSKRWSNFYHLFLHIVIYPSWPHISKGLKWQKSYSYMMCIVLLYIKYVGCL